MRVGFVSGEKVNEKEKYINIFKSILEELQNGDIQRVIDQAKTEKWKKEGGIKDTMLKIIKKNDIIVCIREDEDGGGPKFARDTAESYGKIVVYVGC